MPRHLSVLGIIIIIIVSGGGGGGGGSSSSSSELRKLKYNWQFHLSKCG